MAKEMIIEPEVKQALECIKNKKNFILTGGAGSGKTYSLISLINQVSQIYKSSKIVCITYTNNAVFEIRQRSSNDNLYVSTIHEFLWKMIKKFQFEIKETLVDLINDKKQRLFKLPEGLDSIDIEFFNGQKIKYDEYYRITRDGDSTISHDHILILAELMFIKYKKLCDILKDTANLIFIDEYQDTSREVVDILLKHIKKSSKDCVIGFFGDSMQSIYDSGIGEIKDENIEAIYKEQNRRNPLSVINVGNSLRSDGLIQKPSNDINATNMIEGEVLKGKVTFLYCPIDEKDKFAILDNAKKEKSIFSNWNFSVEETKELWLTHKINAEKSGFLLLYNLYDKDPIKELIDILKKKTVKQGLILEDDRKLGELFVENNMLFDNKNRGNLYDNACINHQKELNIIIEKPWKIVKKQVLKKESLLTYKYDGLTNSYKAESSRDPILLQLDDIYEIIDLYKNNNMNKFIKKTSYKINSILDRKNLAILINELITYVESDKKIEDIILYALNKELVYKRDRFNDFIKDRGFYLWNRIKEIPFSQYLNSIEYQKGVLPFTTQHSVKGSEYDHVLVVLDNGDWNKYNFEKFFLGNGKDSVMKRTQKLFYVCVTRAKKELVVYMAVDENTSDGEKILEKAGSIFGEENVVSIAE